MSGPVLTFNPATVTGPEAQPGDTREAPPILQQIADGFLIGQADTTANNAEVIDDAYDPLIDPLLERGYDVRQLVIGNRGGTYSYNGIWAAIRAERERDPEAFSELPETREEFEQAALQAYARQVGEAEERSERGSIAPQFVGGVAGAMTDPLNLYTLPVGGFGKTVAGRILSEGAVNAGVELLLQPGVQAQREALGRRDLTLGEAAQNVAFAFAGGAAFRGAFEGGSAAVGAIRRLDPNLPDKEFARAFAELVPEHLRTPEQEAALSILTRQAEIEDGSPFVRTYEGSDTHFARLQAAMDALEAGRIPTQGEIAGAGARPIGQPIQRAAARVRFGDGAREEIKAAIRGPESGGNPRARNRMGSSASGLYQFIEETFTRLYRQEYRVSAEEAQRAWDANREDLAVQERLMDRLLDENAAALERAGLPADAGNLYLAHFAGSRKAVELLEADPSRPVSDFFGPTAIRQNPTYLGGGKSVGEAIAIIRGKVGDPAQRSPAPLRDAPELRDPALDAERPSQPLAPTRSFDDVEGEIAPLMEPLAELALNTRRSLNQVEALAEELGSEPATVRAALQELVDRGMLTRNSKTGNVMRKAAAPITPANVKRPRTLVEFLAERGGINDHGGDLRALGIGVGDKRFGQKIIRSIEKPDGLTVRSGEGYFALDTAFRDAREAGYFPELEGLREGGYDELLDGRALLLDAINEELSGAPRYRMDDWDRLGEYKLKGSTEEIYGGFRRGAEEEGDSPLAALQDDFRRAWEEFGNDPADLDPAFLARAAELYESGEAFLPEVALAMAAREDYEAVIARAIEEGLEAEYGASYDPWDPTWQQELERRFRDEIARRGDSADGSARAGSEGERGAAGEGGADSAADARGGPDAQGRAGPTERELDELAAARPRSDHTNLPAEPDPRFAEVDGEGIRATSESVWHDIEAQADFAAPTPEQKRAALQSRTEGGIRPKGETRAAGEDGGLFDNRDTTGDLFDLGDGKGERSAAEIREEIDTEKSGLEAMRSCLK